MTTISAKTILRSRNASAPEHVLSTLLLRYPRWIHAEFMTHRTFSRNAASSRAIPVEKLIEDVLRDTAIPLYWGKNQRGMQAHEECDAPVELFDLHQNVGHYWASRGNAWLKARENAIETARAFDKAGYHKQIVNRLLEPFSHITVLVSATEWSNFLELRDHPDAEPHIRMLAQEIRKCLDDESTIRTLQPGEWHLPFTTDDDEMYVRTCETSRFTSKSIEEALLKLSAARCASTSYKTVDGFDMTLERAEQVFDKLATSKPIHASPFEHVACADKHYGSIEGREYDSPFMVWPHYHQHRNFVGFRQYRAMIGA